MSFTRKPFTCKVCQPQWSAQPVQLTKQNVSAFRSCVSMVYIVLDSVAGYEKLHRAGEGTYGVCYKAKDRATGEVVALKKVRMDRARDGIPLTSIREVRVLQECRHPNIVTLHKVVTGSKADSVFLVFEWVDHDMGRLLDAMPRCFSLPEVKCLVQQLLRAVAHLHRCWVVHRDIKMSNLLYSSSCGLLKLCDFGLARYFPPVPGPMTPRVVTLWYRPPELLLGAEVYGEAVDMWSVGCVMGELLRHAPLFPAHSEPECLRMQCELLGTPTPRTWKGLSSLPHFSMLNLPHQPENHLHKVLGTAAEGCHACLDLLQSLLAFDPDQRISAEAALNHPFFSDSPKPLPASLMPSFRELIPSGAPGSTAQLPRHRRPGAAGPESQEQDHTRGGPPARQQSKRQRDTDLDVQLSADRWQSLLYSLIAATGALVSSPHLLLQAIDLKRQLLQERERDRRLGSYFG
ncbi:hypothetical protein QJQ45_023668 [Haematococcus lacustris]|nr:hypothetical protein QJQ45_023668 [Haematococcus lacustris]